MWGGLYYTELFGTTLLPQSPQVYLKVCHSANKHTAPAAHFKTV